MATTTREIDLQIRRLEEQKKLIAERDSVIPAAIETLAKFAAVLTPAQRRKVAGLVADDGVPAAKATKKATKKRAGAKVPPKYRLPTGEEWTGRGRTPKAFVSWPRTKAGREWARENPGEKYPPADGTSTPAAPVAKAPARKAGKKVATKKARKATKKTGKRAAPRKAAKAAASTAE